MQLNIVAFWVLLQPHDKTTMLGIGNNDMSNFKKFLAGINGIVKAITNRSLTIL